MTIVMTRSSFLVIIQELVQQLRRWESEARSLALQVERLQSTNEELNRKIDELVESRDQTRSSSPLSNGAATGIHW